MGWVGCRYNWHGTDRALHAGMGLGEGFDTGWEHTCFRANGRDGAHHGRGLGIARKGFASICYFWSWHLIMITLASAELGSTRYNIAFSVILWYTKTCIIMEEMKSDICSLISFT
jgi:hypothetical protein